MTKWRRQYRKHWSFDEPLGSPMHRRRGRLCRSLGTLTPADPVLLVMGIGFDPRACERLSG